MPHLLLLPPPPLLAAAAAAAAAAAVIHFALLRAKSSRGTGAQQIQFCLYSIPKSQLCIPQALPTVPLRVAVDDTVKLVRF